uniref:Uncharacterized protein MANES_04G048800 n=1 Tax=Rhizophora mucronata TaxID=61149 RepID=A0A2P2KBS2_RHIMU
MISSVKALAFSPCPSLSPSPSPSSLQQLLAAKWALKLPRNSFSVKRRRSARRLWQRSDLDKNFDYGPTTTTTKTISFDEVTGVNKSFRLVLDVNQLSFLASSRFRQLVSSANDAFSDLKTLVNVDDNNRVVFSCRESTLQFMGAVLVCGLVLIFAFRFLVNLGLRLNRKLGFRGRDVHVVVRRDRSLGGKEVVVARKSKERDDVKKKNKSNDYFRVSDNPLWSLDQVFGSGVRKDDWRTYSGRTQAKLPKWWPESVAAERDLVVDKQGYQREANRLMRG